ncbi:hypothetical protein OUZ56_031939 [Daphnia magna]|uniref:Uncharacterized protein n=1 Tax=Daphnia magna TaxID=35525 RepID=A0ABQ9ZVS9_9CRUS|nr:hypothetical protein OUZ56_031939 [Daphnia magna]
MKSPCYCIYQQWTTIALAFVALVFSIVTKNDVGKLQLSSGNRGSASSMISSPFVGLGVKKEDDFKATTKNKAKQQQQLMIEMRK